MRILITDVTEMHQGNYCVAGWVAAQGRMVRPLPGGSNWTAALLLARGITPGATIQVTPSGAQPNGVYPHRTEDTPIEPATIALIMPGPKPWFGVGAPPTADTLSGAFLDHVRTTGEWDGAKKAAHVHEGTQIGSLAAVKIARDNLEFFEGDYQGKKSLRAYLEDEEERYTLPVVAKGLRETYRANGVDAVNELLPEAGLLHVRVGLARAWAGQPGKCTVMINGVYW